MQKGDVKNFYDIFSKTYLINDLSKLNLRLEAIKKLCKNFIKRDATILEIGCGIGIISKFLGKKARKVVSIDISKKNIAVADLYANSKKNIFKEFDVTNNSIESLKAINNNNSYDVVLIADVLEHILKEKHEHIFREIEQIISEDGLIIITIPSPEYNEYLEEFAPEALQIVDEKIYLDDILHLIRDTTLSLVYFKYVNIFKNNDYIHLVLKRGLKFKKGKVKRTLLVKFFLKTKRIYWRTKNRFFLIRSKNTFFSED